jgi:hypothetical protein
MQIKISMASVALGLTSLLAAGPAAADITYSASFETARGNPVTHVVILESDGTAVQGSILRRDLPGRGTSTIRHDPGFEPVRSLIVGLTLGADDDGNDKKQIVMFLDEGFAANNEGKPYSDAFPGVRHSVTIAKLEALAGGDDGEMAWFTDELFTGPASAAAFPSRGGFRVFEFTTGDDIGGSQRFAAPAASAVGTALLAIALATFAIRRLAR